ncbi:PA2817 family protein [Bermanella sp. R86510]|uniref:PA2817 family protein n=1 Tax=unclassified Bermanella TaxID=2627862 RepID=UPI0037CA42B8
MQTYNPRNHTLILLKDFRKTLEQGIPFNQETLEEEDASFLAQLDAIVTGLEDNQSDAGFDGQAWLSRLFRNYPTIAPIMPREVLWYFGGEALHFMPDEEIQKFQTLDEMVADGHDYLETKIALFNK